MSAIDCYDYEVLGILEAEWQIPVYRLLQDVAPSPCNGFDGNKGDLLIGGGSGESAALRVCITDAIQFITDQDKWYEENPDKDWFGDIVKHFWSTTATYKFGNLYEKLGWSPHIGPMESWLASHLVQFVIDNYYEDYKDIIGPDRDGDFDGKIFRLPKRKSHCIRSCPARGNSGFSCEDCR